ncbi:MAG: hypothetical protein AAB676_14490 [Verrucomicrobiota bacterium]
MHVEKLRTMEAVKPGDASNLAPEFLRTDDVRKIFGIRRGSLYGLAKLGKVKSCLLRIRGNRLGVRLWSVDSIRGLIREGMEASENGDAMETKSAQDGADK